jgi:putative nucleotidyltransferase with HDIG domain
MSDSKVEIRVINIQELETGMSITNFLDVPDLFNHVNEKMIKFLVKYDFTEMMIIRDGSSKEVDADDLKAKDQIIYFGRMNRFHAITNQATVDILIRFGFKRIEVQVTKEKIAPLSQKQKHTIEKEKSRGNLGQLQNVMKESEQIVDKGVQILQEIFDQGKTKGIHLSGAVEIAKQLTKNVAKNQKATHVLTTLRDHDEYTFHHCVDVANQNLMVCQHMKKLSESEMELVSLGGLLHDIGKSRIPHEILNKPGALTDREWEYMRMHPVYSAKMMNDQNLDRRAIAIAYWHHVKKNGKGYPEKDFGAIGELAKLTAISDVYQALVTKRPYKKTDTPNVALNRISKWAKDDFDEKLVEIFIQAFGIYPPGSFVELSDFRKAFVIGGTINAIQPKIVVVIDADEEEIETPDFIDLSLPEYRTLSIIGPIDHRPIYGNNAVDVFLNLTI